jgi:hypothetical protein
MLAARQNAIRRDTVSRFSGQSPLWLKRRNGLYFPEAAIQKDFAPAWKDCKLFQPVWAQEWDGAIGSGVRIRDFTHLPTHTGRGGWCFG